MDWAPGQALFSVRRKPRSGYERTGNQCCLIKAKYTVGYALIMGRLVLAIGCTHGADLLTMVRCVVTNTEHTSLPFSVQLIDSFASLHERRHWARAMDILEIDPILLPGGEGSIATVNDLVIIE